MTTNNDLRTITVCDKLSNTTNIEFDNVTDYGLKNNHTGPLLFVVFTDKSGVFYPLSKDEYVTIENEG